MVPISVMSLNFLLHYEFVSQPERDLKYSNDVSLKVF